MDIAVSPKTARRRGVTKKNILHGSSTEEQRSRRAVFGETLEAEAVLPCFEIAPCLQIALATRARHFSNQPKIFLSSNIHSFSTGCYSLSLDYWSHWSFESLWSYKSLYAKPEESLDKAQMRAVSAGGATVRTQREYNEYVAAILIPASDILKGAKQAPEAKGETEKPADTAAPSPPINQPQPTP